MLQTVDENGNPTAQPGIAVTAAISSGPSGTLANQTATTDANGQAAFSGLAVTGVAGNYTLSFSAPGLGGVTSTPFAITEGSAARLAFVTQPSTAARSRLPLVSQPVLQIQDASGNSIAQAGVMVTVSALPSGTTVTGEAVADRRERTCRVQRAHAAGHTRTQGPHLCRSGAARARRHE